jgi:hypothetical protein
VKEWVGPVGMVRLEVVKVHLARMADLDHLTPLAKTVIVGLAVMADLADLALMADIADNAEVLRASKVVMFDLRMTSIQSQIRCQNAIVT